ncbi:unnamed protein product [Lactuca saligna]|uniref:Uncharacterized protein n=1 Tax=Lactuca saligna TaxID=75948 RepID=A0AA35YMV1_LACSI|nr:unnamed protein product [Lactuca saligna]
MGSLNSTIQNYRLYDNFYLNSKTCYGYPLGIKFGGNFEFNFGFIMRNGVRALKNGDDRNWWNFPTLNAVNISPPAATTILAPRKKRETNLVFVPPFDFWTNIEEDDRGRLQLVNQAEVILEEILHVFLSFPFHTIYPYFHFVSIFVNGIKVYFQEYERKIKKWGKFNYLVSNSVI